MNIFLIIKLALSIMQMVCVIISIVVTVKQEKIIRYKVNELILSFSAILLIIIPFAELLLNHQLE